MVQARTSIAPGLAACLVVGLLLGGLVVGFEPVGGDPDRIYRPIKAELARSLREGRPPFWSDHFGLGVPLVAESHVAAFYPPNWALYRLLDVSTAYRLAMWLHYIALAASSYAYARVLGVTPWGAAVSALSFTLCGFQTIHSSHEWAYHALPYLPLCPLLADRYAATGRPGWLAGLALAWGAQLTVGHFQVQMWTGGLALITGAWRVVADRRPYGRVVGLVAGLAWGGAVASAQLVPTWELARLVGQTRRTFAELAFYSYPPAHWCELAIPTLFRHIRGGPEAPYWYGQQTTGYEACLFVGTVPLVLAVVGFLGEGRDRLGPWRWIVPLSFGLAAMPRWWPAGYAMVLQLPGLGYFRCPARYTAVTSLGLALLAGRGLDRAISARRFRVGVALAALVSVSAFGWAFAWSLGPEFRSSLDGEMLLSRMGMAATSWVVAFGALIAWRRGRVGGWLVLGLCAVEMGCLYYAFGTTRWGWSVPIPSASPMLTRLSETPGVGRVAGPLDNLPVRAGLDAAAPYFGFPMPPPNDLLKVMQEREAAADPFADRWRRRLGVSHAVWDGPVPEGVGEVVFGGPDPALDRLAQSRPGSPEHRPWRIVRLPEPWPWARAATEALVFGNRRTMILRLFGEELRDVASFLKTDAPAASNEPRARSARVVRRDGDEVEVEHDGACDLVLARTWYPGWTAGVDGGPERPTLPVDGGLQAVRISGKGVSRVRLRYRPAWWPTAGVVSLGAVAAALGVLMRVAPGR